MSVTAQQWSDAYTLPVLQQICTRYGIAKSGSKIALAERLLLRNSVFPDPEYPLTTRVKKPDLVMNNSTNKNIWTLDVNHDRISEIIEMEEIQERILGSYRSEVIRLYSKLEQMHGNAKKKFGPDIDFMSFLAMRLSDGFADCVVKKTNSHILSEEKDLPELDSLILSYCIGRLVRENLLALSQVKKKKIVLEGSIPRVTDNVYHGLVHSLRCTRNNSLFEAKFDGLFEEPLLLYTEFNVPARLINDDLAEVRVGQNFCLDDDHINLVGNDVEDGLLTTRVDKRKGNGTPIHTVASVVTGVVSSVTLAGTKRFSPAEIVDACGIQEGHVLAQDRGYTDLSLVSFLNSKSIGNIGIIPEHLRADHPANFATTSFSNLEAIDESKLKPDTILSYEGVGLETFLYERKSDRVKAVAVVNKTNKSKHGVIRFLGCGDIISNDLASKYVRISKSMRDCDKRISLILSRDEGDLIADTLVDSCLQSCKFLTLTQLTADWFVMRRTGLTASNTSALIKEVLKFTESNADAIENNFDSVRSCLWKNVTTYDDDEAVSPIDEAFLAVNLPVEEADVSLDPPDSQSVLGAVLSLFEDQYEPPFHLAEEISDENEISQAPLLPIPLETTVVSTSSASNIDHDTDNLVSSLYDKYIKNSFVTKHAETDGERTGKLTEKRAVQFLSKNLKCIQNGKVYTLGLLASNSVDYVYASPDGIFQLELSKIPKLEKIKDVLPKFITDILAQKQGTIPCGLEIKCSKDFHPNVSTDLNIEVVVAGSKEYHGMSNIKSNFKLQLLQQSFVLGTRFQLLSTWAPKGHSKQILIYYPEQLHQQYKEFVSSVPFARMFRWFHSSASVPQNTDGYIVEAIPYWVTSSSRRLIKSHIPLLASIFRQVKQRAPDDPYPPTHTFRPAFIAIYDFKKGATDVECRAIADAWKGMTCKLKGVSKMTVRLFYTSLIAAVKCYSIWKYVKEVGIDNLPSTLYEFRHNVRRNTPINDLLWDLGEKLMSSQLPWGRLQTTNFQSTLPSCSTPKVSRKITAKHVLEMKTYLENRTGEFQEIKQIDFIGESSFPINRAAYSLHTPGGFNYKPSHIAFIESLEPAFREFLDSALTKSQRMDKWRREFAGLRLTSLIAHQTIEKADPSRPRCVLCDKRCRTIKVCLFCGEHLCDPCNHFFHTDYWVNDEPAIAQDNESQTESEQEDEEKEKNTSKKTGKKLDFSQLPSNESSKKDQARTDAKTPIGDKDTKAKKSFPIIQSQKASKKKLKTDSERIDGGKKMKVSKTGPKKSKSDEKASKKIKRS